MNTKLISELQDEKYQLVSDSQDIEFILESIGLNQADDIGGLLIEVLDGEYGEVWGFYGCVAYLNKTALQLNP